MGFEVRFDNTRANETSINTIMNTVKGVDRHTISYEACNEIYRILDVADMKDAEDVRAVRNSVVKYFSNLRKSLGWYTDDMRNRTEKYDFDKDMEFSMWVSAITAALDNLMYKIDPRSMF